MDVCFAIRIKDIIPHSNEPSPSMAQLHKVDINSDCPFRSGKPLLIITHCCDADCISQTVQAGTYLAVPRFVRLLSPN